MIGFFKLFILVLFVVLFNGCNESSTIVVKEKYLDTNISFNDANNTIVKKDKKSEMTKKRKRKPNPKKEKFKKIMVPIVSDIYVELEKKYQNVKLDIKHNRNKEHTEQLKKEYKAKTNALLLQAIKPHPISIVLAQSAIESAWLSSRFATEANNIFGVWSFDKNEPRIAASGLRGKKTIYLKKYDSYNDAVRDYYKSIGKSWAYKKLRYLRTVTNKPHILLPHLESYSEKKAEYIKILKQLIKNNNFELYDIKETKI